MKLRSILPFGLVVLAVLAAPGLARAESVGTVTITGYGGPDRVYTRDNTTTLYDTVGSANSDPDIFISIFPNTPSFERWDVYLIPNGPIVPGTYSATGGFETRPGLVVQHFGGDIGFSCTGGTFTISSIDTTSPWGLAFDVSWSTNCYPGPGSGHAVFRAVVPPDTTPPTLQLPPGDWVVATTTGNGTNVDYTVTATDDRDPNPQVTCTPPSGSFFPLGLSHVTCTATDNAGNTSAPRYLTVLVLEPDTTPPQFYWIPSFDVPATSPAGAHVDVYVLASDDRGYAAVACADRQTGATIGWNVAHDFPIGDTTVDCTATDEAGNSTKGSFTVHVQGASEQLSRLRTTIDGYGLTATLGQSLQAHVATEKRLVDAGKPAQACHAVDNFLAFVHEHDGVDIVGWQAYAMTLAAQQIEQVIGC
jgi:hypothetical protein